MWAIKLPVFPPRAKISRPRCHSRKSLIYKWEVHYKCGCELWWSHLHWICWPCLWSPCSLFLKTANLCGKSLIQQAGTARYGTKARTWVHQVFFPGGSNLEKLPERQLLKHPLKKKKTKTKPKQDEVKTFLHSSEYLHRFSNSSLLFCLKNLVVELHLYWKSAFISPANVKAAQLQLWGNSCSVGLEIS